MNPRCRTSWFGGSLGFAFWKKEEGNGNEEEEEEEEEDEEKE
jgi:hypothetical protein